jgi:NADH-quinone oxidoreductase subunit E
MQVDLQTVDRIIERWRSDPSFATEMLLDVQAELRHLPEAALERIAHRTKSDFSRLYQIATFYKAFSLEPRGEHSIGVCTGTACQIRGAMRVIEAMTKELGVKPGETTKDLEFTLQGVRCVGCCNLAPVVTVDKDLHGGVESTKVGRLIRRYRKGDKPSPADAPDTEG